MTLLNDGLRVLAKNFSTLLLAWAMLLVLGGVYFFAMAYAANAALPPPPAIAATETPPVAPEATDGTNTAELTMTGTIGGAPTDPVNEPPPVWFLIFGLVAQVGFAAGLSLIYAIVFTMLARDMDRPVWKCEVPGEALRRFFEVWFILTLISTAARVIQLRATTVDAFAAMEFLIMLWSLVVIPLGACVMHHGALAWQELGEILAPIPRQLGAFLVVFFVGLLQYIGQEMIFELVPSGREFYFERAAFATFMNLPLSVVDLLLFCMSWRILILDREATRHGGDGFEE